MLDIVPIARALLLDHIADGMIVVDRQGLVVDANPAAEPLLACAMADALGRPATEVVHAYEGLVPADPAAIDPAAVRTIHVQDAGATRAFEVVATRVPSGGGDAGTLLVFHDVTSRERLHAHLAATARTDPLTGLANRRVLAERIDDALRAATRTGLPVGLLLLDLDRFKAINDTLGHHAGDQCLVSVARRLECCIRPGDTVARLGGDEFVVVLPDLESAAAAEAVANRIVECVSGPIEVAEEWISIAASVGVHIVSDGSGSADDLLRRADAAMYTAKRDPGRHLVLSAS